MQAIDDLQRYRFIDALSPASREVLAREISWHRFPSQKTLIVRGEPVGGAYLVVEGSLRVYNVSAKGRESTLYWVEPGDSCILAMSCLFSDVRYPAWVESDQVLTQLAVIPSEAYKRLFASEPSVQKFTFNVLSSRIFELMTTLEEVTTHDMERRLASFLVRKCDAEGDVAMSQATMAGHLGTAREVVTRILRQFESKGLVAVARGTTRVIDAVALLAHTETSDDD
jgi:CRP/FNR family transcriptional regulator